MWRRDVVRSEGCRQVALWAARTAAAVLLMAVAMVGLQTITMAAPEPGAMWQAESDFGVQLDSGLEYRRSMRLVPIDLDVVDLVEGSQVRAATSAPRKLIIDTDMGVDDAAAVGWLLNQTAYPVEILGFTTVAGNTTIENVVNNLLTLLKAAGHFDPHTGRLDYPVVVGAKEPLTRTLSSTAKFIFGPDGLWYYGQFPPFDTSDLPLANDTEAFYCNSGFNLSETTLLAIGPLTNLAQTSPGCLAQFERIIVVGGAINGGNQTPVSEFNFWADPEAARKFFIDAAEYYPHNIELVVLDTFETMRIKLKDAQDFLPPGYPGYTPDPTVSELVSQALIAFICVKNQDPDCLVNLPPNYRGDVPDVVAAIYAVDDKVGTSMPALVEVIAGPTAPELVRGQSIVGFDINAWGVMVYSEETLSDTADEVFKESPPAAPDYTPLNALLVPLILNPPINARVVNRISSGSVRNIFLNGLAGTSLDVSNLDETADHASNQLYLPIFQGR